MYSTLEDMGSTSCRGGVCHMKMTWATEIFVLHGSIPFVPSSYTSFIGIPFS
jgi:hypothetical protein